jgi:hypothetical protein
VGGGAGAVSVSPASDMAAMPPEGRQYTEGSSD